MLVINGQSRNVNRRIVGRVVTSLPLFASGNNIVYLTKSPLPKWRSSKCCVALISVPQRLHKEFRLPTIYLNATSDYDRLHDGDVVALEPDGRINVLYESLSQHNALFVTEMCNCRCIMCPQPPVIGRDNMVDEVLSIIRLINPSKAAILGISGGEPSLLGDGLLKVITACKYHLPQTHIALLTNAKALNDIEYVRSIVKIGHSNLDFCIPIYASTDSEHDAIVRSSGSFYQTLSAIHNLALFRQNIEIRVVVMKQNYQRLPQWSDFIYRNMPFVRHLAIMGMETTGLAEKNIESVWIDPVECIPILQNVVQYLHQRGMNVSVYNMQLCILPKILWRFSRQSISGWKLIFLADCDKCIVKDKCGGFFESCRTFHSKAISPILS